MLINGDADYHGFECLVFSANFTDLGFTVERTIRFLTVRCNRKTNCCDIPNGKESIEIVYTRPTIEWNNKKLFFAFQQIDRLR